MTSRGVRGTGDEIFPSILYANKWIQYSLELNNKNWFHEGNKVIITDSDFLQQALAILKFAGINDYNLW